MAEKEAARLGKQLAEARKRRGWHLRDVADRTGRSISRISEVELGRTNSSASSLVEAGDAVGLTLMFIPNEKLDQVMALISEPRAAARPTPYDVKSTFSEVFLDDADPEQDGEEPQESPSARR